MSKPIRINGHDDFPCPLGRGWTVEKVKSEIYSAYPLLTGGYIVNNKIATDSSDLIEENGNYEFVNFQIAQPPPPQTGATGGGGSTANTPGDTNAMFIAIALTRGQKSKKNPDGDIISCSPVGSAFALSEDVVFTAYHNVVDTGDLPFTEIGLVKEWREDDMLLDDIIVAKYSAGSGKEAEDWAVYTRDMKGGHFQHYLYVCPENELPLKNERIGIHDFPVGFFTSGSSLVIEQQSFRTKVSTYELVKALNSTMPKQKRVIRKKPRNKRKLSDFRAIQVVGGRIKGSCGAAYVASNGKVVAFHVESLDDGETVSIANSFTSERSHTSFSRGLVLCRIPSFMKWYKRTINP